MKDRVVCIDDAFQASSMKVKKGEIYTVIGIENNAFGKWYILAEGHEGDLYRPIMFRPVDDSYGEWVESTVLQDAILEETLNPIPL